MKATIRDLFIHDQLFSDFHFFNVGHEKCSPNHSFGPNKREHYILHYVVNGQGTFESRGARHKLHAQQFFIIRPNEVTYYQADKEQPWEYYWLGFDGSKVDELLLNRFIDYQTEVGGIDAPIDQVRELFEMLLTTQPFDDTRIFRRYAQVFQLIDYLKGEANIRQGNQRNPKQEYSQLFRLIIHNSYHLKDLSITTIAQSMNLNAAYLSQVIKETMHISPVSYLKEYRLRKAKYLLDTTQLSVSEIADLVGYESVYTFSRAYKNYYYLSPKYHRQKDNN